MSKILDLKNEMVTEIHSLVKEVMSYTGQVPAELESVIKAGVTPENIMDILGVINDLRPVESLVVELYPALAPVFSVASTIETGIADLCSALEKVPASQQ